MVSSRIQAKLLAMYNWILPRVVLALFFFGACGGAQPDLDAPKGADDSMSAEDAEAMKRPIRTDVAFQTVDNKTLTGYMTTGTKSPPGNPGLLLVHQFSSVKYCA